MLPDTDIMIDFMRGYPPAVAWFAAYPGPIRIPGLVAMELIQGCRNQLEQNRVERQLQRCLFAWPTASDCQRAYHDFAAYVLSHGLGLLDALIGHTAVGLNERLATFNVKHYSVISGLTTFQPY